MLNLDGTLVKDAIANDLPTDIVVDYSSINHIDDTDVDIIREYKKISKNKVKKLQINVSLRIMQPVMIALSWHCDYLEADEWFKESNRKEHTTSTHSYSMMHSLEEGYQIVMYSCTRNTDLSKMCVSHNSSVRLILPEAMAVI